MTATGSTAMRLEGPNVNLAMDEMIAERSMNLQDIVHEQNASYFRDEMADTLGAECNVEKARQAMDEQDEPETVLGDDGEPGTPFAERDANGWPLTRSINGILVPQPDLYTLIHKHRVPMEAL